MTDLRAEIETLRDELRAENDGYIPTQWLAGRLATILEQTTPADVEADQ